MVNEARFQSLAERREISSMGPALNPLAFYLMALVAIAGAVASTLVADTRRAAFGMLAMLGATAFILVLMLSLPAAMALLFLVGVPAATLLHLVHRRTRASELGTPFLDRGYWEGLVAILLLVVLYRVVSNSEWDAVEHARLWGTSVADWLAAVFSGDRALALGLGAGLGFMGVLALRRREDA